jgi:hypothetical protein
MNLRITLLLLIAIIVVITVLATLVVVPGPVNERVQLLMPVKR